MSKRGGYTSCVGQDKSFCSVPYRSPMLDLIAQLLFNTVGHFDLAETQIQGTGQVQNKQKYSHNIMSSSHLTVIISLVQFILFFFAHFFAVKARNSEDRVI